jgi:hypothetical protein
MTFGFPVETAPEMPQPHYQCRFVPEGRFRDVINIHARSPVSAKRWKSSSMRGYYFA